MPRLGRFLYGDWPEAIDVEPIRDTCDTVTAGAGYRTLQGVEHRRQIALRDKRLTCTDRVNGPFKLAILRWRLKPGCYRIEGDSVVGADMKVTIRSDEIPLTLSLTSGKESRFYRQSTDIPIIEALIKGSGSVVSDIWF